MQKTRNFKQWIRSEIPVQFQIDLVGLIFGAKLPLVKEGGDGVGGVEGIKDDSHLPDAQILVRCQG